MMQAFIIAAIIAVLAVVGGYYSWSQSKGVSFALGVVAIIASFFALIFGLFAAIGLLFKLLPVLLLIGAAWFLYSVMSKKS